MAGKHRANMKLAVYMLIICCVSAVIFPVIISLEKVDADEQGTESSVDAAVEITGTDRGSETFAIDNGIIFCEAQG